MTKIIARIVNPRNASMLSMRRFAGFGSAVDPDVTAGRDDGLIASPASCAMLGAREGFVISGSNGIGSKGIAKRQRVALQISTANRRCPTGGRIRIKLLSWKWGSNALTLG